MENFLFFLYEMDRVEDITTMASLKQKIRRMENSKKMDEIRVELMTFPMLRERATNYATRPLLSFKMALHL